MTLLTSNQGIKRSRLESPGGVTLPPIAIVIVQWKMGRKKMSASARRHPLNQDYGRKSRNDCEVIFFRKSLDVVSWVMKILDPDSNYINGIYAWYPKHPLLKMATAG